MQNHSLKHQVGELDAKASHKKTMAHIKTPTVTRTDFLYISLHVSRIYKRVKGTPKYTCNKDTKDDTKLLMLEHGPVDNFTVFRLPCQKEMRHIH